jgi:hypothetical protein
VIVIFITGLPAEDWGIRFAPNRHDIQTGSTAEGRATR